MFLFIRCVVRYGWRGPSFDGSCPSQSALPIACRCSVRGVPVPVCLAAVRVVMRVAVRVQRCVRRYVLVVVRLRLCLRQCCACAPAAMLVHVHLRL
eukprot:SAG11_NODE_1154_length_5662_cov_3.473665_3_plen_96_part_00